MALWSTQPLTEMSTTNISWGRRGVGLTTLPPSCVDCLEVWEPQTSGTLRECPGPYWDCFTFIFTHFLYLYVIGCSSKSKEHGK